MQCNHLFLNKLLPLSLCVVGMGTLAQAQPDVPMTPTETPADTPAAKRPGYRGILGGRPLHLPLPPETLRLLNEERTKAKVAEIKEQLTKAGFADAALQTAVVGEFRAKDAAQTDLEGQWQKINQALEGKKMPAADLKAMIQGVRAAVAKEKARHDAASAALETQFHLSQTPALDALLMTMGITGDEASIEGQPNGGSAFF